MIFKRASVRYAKTPAPLTPYQAAQQVWDDRIGAARVQAYHWRLMALGSLLVSFAIVGGLIWQLGRSTVTPFVVEVDAEGQVRAVGPAAENYRPTDAQIEHHLSRFIRDVRSLPLDPIVLRDDWLEAYDFASDKAALTLNEYARQTNPFEQVGRRSVATEMVSVVRASADSFQLRWIERKYSDGSLSATEHWTAMVSIVLQSPHDESRLRKNPLGIYVTGLDWSRELSSN
jgi:type IV secretory pathway TrbF-like protein